MTKSLLRTDKEITEIYERHMKTVCRVCFAYMKNKLDNLYESVSLPCFSLLVWEIAAFIK